jgi:hypothetical protein
MCAVALPVHTAAKAKWIITVCLNCNARLADTLSRVALAAADNVDFCPVRAFFSKEMLK